MNFRLVYTERAVKDITSLDKVIKDRVGGALRRLEKDPRATSKRLTQPALGTFRFRVGD